MQTQAMSAGGAADAFFGWTVIQLILMGVAAALVIAGMIYGRRLAHQRHRAQQAAKERAEEAGIEPPEEVPPAEVEHIVPVAKQPDPDLPVVVAPKREPKPVPAPALAPKPVPAPTPVAAAEPAPAPAVEPAIAGALALTTIKGLGPKVAALLAERGITRVDQVAALGSDDATALDAQLGAFTGRMVRDRWVDQAKLLASGDTAAYEAEFGKLG